MADSKLPKKPHIEPGVASEHPGKQSVSREEEEERGKLSPEIFEEISKWSVQEIETLYRALPVLLHEAKNRLGRSEAKKIPKLEHSKQGALSFRDRCMAIFELIGGPRSWRYQRLSRFPTEEIFHRQLLLTQISDPVKTTEPDTAKEGKKVAEKPEATTDDDWKPVLSVRTWRWMDGIFVGLCLIILAIDVFLGPSKVPVILVCAGALGMLFLAAHAIYEWWHWVST